MLNSKTGETNAVFTCFGWANLRTTTYETDDAGSARLVSQFEEYVAARFGDWFSLEIHVSRGLNWAGPCFTIMGCFNHRREEVIDLFRWVAENGPGSYGLLYVQDDEDPREAYENAFRVWRLARGTLTEHEDPFLSPRIPVIEDPFDPDRPDDI